MSFDTMPIVSPQPRRRFMSKLASLGIGLATLPMVRRPALADAQATLLTWDGYGSDEVLAEYLERRGALPTVLTFDSQDEAFSQLQEGIQVDVAHPCADIMPYWRRSGLLQPIDTGRLSHWPDLFESLRDQPGLNENGQQWFVPIDWGFTSVIYRADLVDIPEESLGLLWDERYAGRLATGGDVTEPVMTAALLAGIADPYHMSPADLGKVRQLLEKQAPLLKFYWSDVTTLESALASGEIVAGLGWTESYIKLRQQGVDVRLMKPIEGSLAWSCGAVLTSSATEIDAAHDVIDSMISPRAGAWMIANAAGHSNRKAFDLADQAALDLLGLDRDPTQTLARTLFLRENAQFDVIERMMTEIRGAA